MVWLAITLAGLILVVLLLSNRKQHTFPPKIDRHDSDDWKYGDIWKQDSLDESGTDQSQEFVPILRGETGWGYDDTLMNDFVLYLGSKGIRASYDSFPLDQVNVYVLKVEVGKENEARKILQDKFSEEVK